MNYFFHREGRGNLKTQKMMDEQLCHRGGYK